MRMLGCLAVLSLLLVVNAPVLADENASSSWLAAAGEVPSPAELNAPSGTWLAQATKPTAPVVAEKQEEKEVKAEGGGKAPPLPLHTIEGVGGTLTVPVAYLVNPGPKGTQIGLPSVSYTYLNTSAGKNLMVAAVTETFFRRVEIGYALGRFGLGSLPRAVRKATGGTVGINDEVWLNQFHGSVVLIEENQFGPWTPQVTAGTIFKYNQGIDEINHDLNGGLRAIGYRRNYGTDFTLTASKMVVVPLVNRPFIFTVGGRNSSASNIGYTGFTDQCVFSVETSVICMITDKLAAFYEFRQKDNPYDTVPGLIGDESSWHGAALAYIISPNLVVAVAYGRMGEMGNSDVDGAWGLQIKWEF